MIGSYNRWTLVVILAGGKGERLGPLTTVRCKPAVPFGGLYRIIDMTLSNCINSGLRRIFVFTQYVPASLNRHLREGWRFISRPTLGEYVVPLDHWFRNELKDYAGEMLLDPQTLGRGYFRPEAVRRLWDDHQQRRFDHSARLWALLVLELWHRQWAGKNHESVPPEADKLA